MSVDATEIWAPLEPEDRIMSIEGHEYVVTGGKIGYWGARVRKNGHWEKRVDKLTPLDPDDVRAMTRQHRVIYGKQMK
jgi:hypothetical protein